MDTDKIIDVNCRDYYNDLEHYRSPIDIVKSFTFQQHQYTLIDQFIGDRDHRWHQQWNFIYRRDDNKYFKATYLRGKSEYQQDLGFQQQDDQTIRLIQVYRKRKIIYYYSEQND